MTHQNYLDSSQSFSQQHLRPTAWSLLARGKTGGGGSATLVYYKFLPHLFFLLFWWLLLSPLPPQEAPTNKLLYAKDIPTYKEEVKSYYKAIRDSPPLSSSEMEEFLTQESKVSLESRNKLIFGYFKSFQNLSTSLSFRNTKMNLMKKWPWQKFTNTS